MMFNFTCPVCGGMMVHSRLRGYHCHFEAHNRIADELVSYDLFKLRTLTDEEIVAAMENAPPVFPSDDIRERAMKAMREAGKRRAVKFN